MKKPHGGITSRAVLLTIYIVLVYFWKFQDVRSAGYGLYLIYIMFDFVSVVMLLATFTGIRDMMPDAIPKQARWQIIYGWCLTAAELTVYCYFQDLFLIFSSLFIRLSIVMHADYVKVAR